MPKRKSSDNEEDSFSVGASEAAEAETESSPRKWTRKKEENTPRKRTKVKSDSEEAANANSALNNSSDLKIKIQKNTEGDSFVDLGKRKRATIRTFKGMTLLDIREYYVKDREEKPGKKGISLTVEQWQFLRDNSGTIDGLFAEQKKK